MRTSNAGMPRLPRPSAKTAALSGLQRIIYLGGLGDDKDTLSAHRRSRRKVEKLLRTGGVPVTVVRAGIIAGHGGSSWELTRQPVELLPVMITPRWVATRTQPIAADDVVRYLTGVLALPGAAGRVFEIGGQRCAAVHHHAAPRGRHLGHLRCHVFDVGPEYDTG